MANEKRLIDANALLDEVSEMYINHFADSSYQFIHDFVKGMCKRVQKAPTIDAVEVVHGRWVFENNPYMRDSWLYRCTACDARSGDNSPYCPNCGAKMDGDGNEK